MSPETTRSRLNLEFSLVVSLFGVSYGLMIRYFMEAVKFHELLYNIPCLFMTVLLFGGAPISIILLFIYHSEKEQIQPASGTSVSGSQFFVRAGERIIAVAGAPYALFFLTAYLLQTYSKSVIEKKYDFVVMSLDYFLVWALICLDFCLSTYYKQITPSRSGNEVRDSTRSGGKYVDPLTAGLGSGLITIAGATPLLVLWRVVAMDFSVMLFALIWLGMSIVLVILVALCAHRRGSIGNVGLVLAVLYIGTYGVAVSSIILLAPSLLPVMILIIMGMRLLENPFANLGSGTTRMAPR